MMWIESDPDRLIDLMIHEGPPLTEADLSAIEAACKKTGSAGASRFAVSLVLVESDHSPDARQRKRIAEAMKGIPRCYEVLVTKSAAVRAVTTAIRWLVPGDPNRVQSTHASYREALAYLVEKTGQPAVVFDTLHTRLRARMKAG